MPHSQDTRHMRYETLYIMLLIFASGLFLAGALLDTPDNIARGLIRIVMTEDPLITDYVRLAGVGAALINSSVVTALSVLILRSSGEPANGFTLVVVGLMAGFSLFGKNPVNTWPIVLGTWLYAKSRKEPFGKYAAVALLSSALGPVISYIILDNGWAPGAWGGDRPDDRLCNALSVRLYIQDPERDEPVQCRVCLRADGHAAGVPDELLRGGAGGLLPLGHRVQRSVRRAAGDDVHSSHPCRPVFLQEAGLGGLGGLPPPAPDQRPGPPATICACLARRRC